MDKKELTAQIIKELNLKIDVDSAYSVMWWPNTLNNKNHKRLTSYGNALLSKHTKSYSFPFEFSNTPNLILQLTKIDSPYYVDRGGTIILYSSKLATAVTMFENFERYLEVLNQ